MQEEYKTGAVAETDAVTVYVNYDKDAKAKELIKFVPKEGQTDVVISADDILGIIATQLKKKDLAVALSNAEINEIPMIETIRPIDITFEKDFKKGEHIQFLAPIMYPYFLAVAEEAYKLCETRGQIKIITKDVYDEVAETLIEKNKEFIEKFYAHSIKKTS